MNRAKVLLVTATETERNALESILHRYYSGHVVPAVSKNCVVRNDNIEIHCCHLGAMGNLCSLLVVSEKIKQIHPVCVIAVGVCAGIPHENVHVSPPLGSIIVSDRVVYYELQKISAGGKIDFRHRIWSSPVDESIVEKYIQPKFSSDCVDYLKSISPLRDKTPLPVMEKSVYASGEKVVNDKEFRNTLESKLQIEKGVVGAMDMESAGIAYACRESATNFIIAKAICDFAEDKTDLWQQYAASVSAFAAINFCFRLNPNDLTTLWLKRNIADLPEDKYLRAIRLARIAGQNLTKSGVDDFINKKGIRDDIVTDFDKLNNLFFTYHLKDDQCEVVAEEGDTEFDIDAAKECLIIDPVDGTLNLHLGRSEVAISVARYRGKRPLQAIINLPFRDITVSATAHKFGIDVNRLPWKCQRKSPFALSDAFVCLPGDICKLSGLKGGSDGILLELFKSLPQNIRGLRVTGALAYDLASLALGEIDIRISTHAKDTDVAAGALLVRQVGGVVTDFSGNDWEPKDASTGVSTQLVASANPTLHNAILKFINGLVRKIDGKQDFPDMQ